jgi:hypothetical protein
MSKTVTIMKIGRIISMLLKKAYLISISCIEKPKNRIPTKSFMINNKGK